LDAMSLLRHHGDAEVGAGLVDFAVNVQGTGPPRWLSERLSRSLDSLGSYPSADADLRAREAVAHRHGRAPEEVLLLAGGAEGFAMLPQLKPRLAALIHPSFTEPELALRQAGIPVRHVVSAPPFQLDPSAVPEDADMVVVGNPTNPTSVLHERHSILGLRRPGRIVVVDEAFADAVPGEAESVASDSLDDVLVLRSLTKTWALAGLRCGYALGHPDVLAELTVGRAHWPLGSLQIEAIEACSEPDAVASAEARASVIAAEREDMTRRLTALGIDVHGPARGPFLLLSVPDAEGVRRRLRDHGVAVRRCDTFPGLAPGHLRVAVRPSAQVDVLVDALTKSLPKNSPPQHARSKGEQ